MAATNNNLHVPDDLLDRAQRIADAEGRTANDVAADALKRYIERRETVQELQDLGSWGERHARQRGYKPSDVERAISEIPQDR
jgi:predicted transcriptional regulator